MNSFRTELFPQPTVFPLNLKDAVFTVGSCFANEMSNRLADNKLETLNPFETVYDPISIHRLLFFGLTKNFPGKESYSQNQDVHFNYHFHSSFSSLNRNELETQIQNAILASNDFLKNASRIIITYGTAFVYRLKTTNGIVANCHKMPSINFDKQLLTESEIIKSFEEVYSKLKTINPNTRVILTVSPVRHLKDTLELNSVSKSVLRMACHSITHKFSDVEYFPAYEILLDDLRDYRFYKTDRLHPTEEAVEYIWEKFVEAYFDKPTKIFLSDWKKIKNDLAHKPFQPQSEKHAAFLNALLKKLEDLKTTIDVKREIEEVKSRL